MLYSNDLTFLFEFIFSLKEYLSSNPYCSFRKTLIDFISLLILVVLNLIKVGFKKMENKSEEFSILHSQLIILAHCSGSTDHKIDPISEE